MNKIDLIIEALERANELWLTEPMGEKAIAAAYELKLELEPQVCCGDYEKCMKACTPRGRWLEGKELRKEWVGLTDDEIWECQKLGLSDDVYKAIEAALRSKNT
jgi:hypothetical protein